MLPNTEILKYCVKGVPDVSKRSLMATLKNTLLSFGVEVPCSFDSYTFYRIYDNRVIMEDRCQLERLSIEDYLYTLLGNNSIQLDWYKNLHTGDIVRIGWCAGASEEYGLGFNTRLVSQNRDKFVTIEEVRPYFNCHDQKWSNNDTNVYRIAEWDHYIPSAVMYPKFTMGKPIKQLEVQSFALLDTLMNNIK